MRKSTTGRTIQPRSRWSDEYGVLLQKLIAARRAAGLRQEDVAGRIGKTRSYISMIETREREVSLTDLLNWCHALGLRFGDFARDWEQEVEVTRQ